jgi:signal transduction histidine kinase
VVRRVNPIVAAGVIGLAVTGAIVFVPSVAFSYRAPVARSMLETSLTLIGCLASLLCLGRFFRSRQKWNLLTAAALAILALGYPILAAFPRALAERPGTRFSGWSMVCAQAVAAGMLVAAAVLRWSDSAQSQALWRRTMAVPPLFLAVVAIPVLAWRAPWGSDGVVVYDRVQFFANPLVSIIQLGTAVLFVIAATSFAQLAKSRADAFMEWLGVGCVLAAIASLNHSLSPSLELAWLHVGDVFMAAAVVAVAVGAVKEIASYWRDMARLARAEERRGLARDLHDGLAQELAYLVSELQSAEAEGAPSDWRRQVLSSAERALADSRRSIQALSTDRPDPFQMDLDRTVQEIMGPGERPVRLVTQSDAGTALLAPQDREHILRILREALTNAVRHGQPHRIEIAFTGAHPRVLRIRDDGVGFDPSCSDTSNGRFGLLNMREVAERMGAQFHISSAPGRGTTLEITWA